MQTPTLPPGIYGNTVFHRPNRLGLPCCGQKLENVTDPKTGIRHNSRWVEVDKPVTCQRGPCQP